MFVCVSVGLGLALNLCFRANGYAAYASGPNAYTGSHGPHRTRTNCYHVAAERCDLAGSDVNTPRVLVSGEVDAYNGRGVRWATVDAFTNASGIDNIGHRSAVGIEVVTKLTKRGDTIGVDVDIKAC